MNEDHAWLAFQNSLRKNHPDLSEHELNELHNCYHYLSCECNDQIATDFSGESEDARRIALQGRYWILRKLTDDLEYWNDYHEGFKDFSADLPHEPAIIATALAFRPNERCEWDAVEAWSWVYRHALMLDISAANLKAGVRNKAPTVRET